MSHLADPKNPQICSLELAVAPEMGGRVALDVKLPIRALGGPLQVARRPQRPPQRPKMTKNDHISKKIKKTRQNQKSRSDYWLILQSSDRLRGLKIRMGTLGSV